MEIIQSAQKRIKKQTRFSLFTSTQLQRSKVNLLTVSTFNSHGHFHKTK